MMPRLDGFGLLKALRTEERTRRLPVSLLSARSGEESALEGLEAGADDYLVQPFSAKELLARVRSSLSLAQLRKEWEAKLSQTNRELAEAAAAKGRFLATMSHEIRTPLNAMIGIAGLLADTPLSDEQKEFASIIRTSGDHLLTIINDILDFSKIESGQLPLEQTPRWTPPRRSKWACRRSSPSRCATRRCSTPSSSCSTARSRLAPRPFWRPPAPLILASGCRCASWSPKTTSSTSSSSRSS